MARDEQMVLARAVVFLRAVAGGPVDQWKLLEVANEVEDLMHAKRLGATHG